MDEQFDAPRDHEARRDAVGDPADRPTGGLDPVTDPEATAVIAVPMTGPADTADLAPEPGEEPVEEPFGERFEEPAEAAGGTAAAEFGGLEPALAAEPAYAASVAAEFPVVIRGYERHRVDAVLAALRSQLEGAVARYETAEAALAAARAAAADAQRAADEARHEAEVIREEAEGRISPATLSERIRGILELAEAEAEEIRARAAREAAEATAGVRAEVAALESRRAELGQELSRLHEKIAALLGGATPR